MLMHQVTCITTSSHPDPHQRITHIGGINSKGRSWRMTVTEAIAKILDGSCTFYVVTEGRRRNLVVSTNRMGSRCLTCDAEPGEPTALLSLRECSSCSA